MRDISAVPTLFLIVVVDLVGFGLVIPLLPFYAVRFAASPQEVTALVAIYSLAQLMTAPLWGGLSDRVGRRPVLIVSLTASALAYLGLGGADAVRLTISTGRRPTRSLSLPQSGAVISCARE